MNTRQSREARELAGHFYVAAREHRTYLRRHGIPEPAAWPAIVELLQTMAVSGRQQPVEALLSAATATPPPSLLTFTEVARRTGWSTRTVGRRVRDGSLPVVGRRIPRSALESYLDKQPT